MAPSNVITYLSCYFGECIENTIVIQATKQGWFMVPIFPAQTHEEIFLYRLTLLGCEVWRLILKVPRLDLVPDGLPILLCRPGLIVDFLQVLVIRVVSVGIVAIVLLFWHLISGINSW